MRAAVAQAEVAGIFARVLATKDLWRDDKRRVPCNAGNN